MVFPSETPKFHILIHIIDIVRDRMIEAGLIEAVKALLDDQDQNVRLKGIGLVSHIAINGMATLYILVIIPERKQMRSAAR